MSRYDVDYGTALKSETRVRADWNLNEVVGVISRPGEPIYYQAPEDPAPHLMYVDAEGRNLPVDSTTLQIMTNGTGHVVDKNGVEVPGYEFKGTESKVHEDDVRVAVAARDIVVSNKDDEEILIAPDGTIIPLNDDGVVGIEMIGGVAWALDGFGNAVAPLERVIALGTYHKPVEARNVPQNAAFVNQPIIEQAWADYFPISSICEGERPTRRGALVAWSTSETSAVASYTNTGEYQQGRFYTTSEDRVYKYWTPDEAAIADPIMGQAVSGIFDSTWTGKNVSNIVTGSGQYSADFIHHITGYPEISKAYSLKPGVSHTVGFTVIAQSSSIIQVYLDKMDHSVSAGGSTTSSKFLGFVTAMADVPTSASLSAVTDNDSTDYVLRFQVVRRRLDTTPRVSFNSLTVNETSYVIEQAGPRVTYDRPLQANKIVIGVDYSVDERNAESSSNMPTSSAVRIATDRGDGVCTWQTIATNALPNDRGFIELYYDGTSWVEDEVWSEQTTTVKAVQYNVWGMNLPGARLNIMEIAAHRIHDLSDRFMDYSLDSEVSDSNFVLPFGTVSANVGDIQLSNHDGALNGDNRFLLDVERYSQDGQFVFTNEQNPFYKMFNGQIHFTVDTCVYDVDNPPLEKEWIRMATMAAGTPRVNSDMTAQFSMKDSSRILQQRKPKPLFFTDKTGMSVIQTIYMLLDSVGVTDLVIEPNDVLNAVDVNYFWSDPEGTVWQALEDICRSTQITAYFDEQDTLRLRSLHGLYQSALYEPPKSILTTDDVGTLPSNIIDINEGELMQTNKVTLNYNELRPGEISESGVAKMEEMWNPDGDVVLRGQNLTRSLEAQEADPKSPHHIFLAPHTTTSWPWEGMVNIEGEYIKYKGKRYLYHNAAGVERRKVIFSEAERKELDKINVELAYKNHYDGLLRITERGAEGTLIRAHTREDRDKYYFTFKDGSAPGVSRTGYASFYHSKLHLRPPSGSDSNTWYVVARGGVYDFPPQFFGTSVNITGGSSTAGLGIGLNGQRDGIYIELMTTEWVEKIGRTRNELAIYVKNGATRKYYGPEKGVVAPISKNKFYDLQASMVDGVGKSRLYTLLQYENTVIKFGSRGTSVKALQKELNTYWNESLVVDGVFGTKTQNAVKRVQKVAGFTQSGVVDTNDWRYIGGFTKDPNSVSVHVWLDGSISHSIVIPKVDLPAGSLGGMYGMFIRSGTTAEFEYLYAFRGSEDLINDGDNGLLSKVTGSYFSDQVNNGMFYQRKYRYVTSGGKRVLRNVINEQFVFDDFGPWAHEMRDWDIKFDKELPSEYSQLYSSNTGAAMIVEYQANPYGAKFRMANTARYDAIINGTDSATFGSENTIEQQMLIYGRTLHEDSQRITTIEDKNSIRSKGVHDLTIDASWIQNEESANKLGSHIVEAMSMPVREFEVELFGNPYLKVGDMVVVFAPAQGAGVEDDINDINRTNRYIVTKVSHSNNGAHETDVTVRQLIDRGGYRFTRLSDVLDHNNNNMLRNQYLDEYEVVTGNFISLVPKDVEAAVHTTATYRSEGSGRGYMQLRGALASTPSSYRQVGFRPKNIMLPSGDRPAHTIGDYFMWTVDVTAITDCSVTLSIEGYNTSGFNKILAERTVRLKAGKHERIVLTGQYLNDGDIPELIPAMFLKKYDGTPGTRAEAVMVHDMFYRHSNSATAIYPREGYPTLRRQ